MASLLQTRPTATGTAATVRTLPARVVAAALSLGVAWIHVKDQGGFPGDKSPHYVGLGYYALEAAGVLTAALLLFARGRALAATWLLAVGVALGPLVGFVLSRGPGLPNYTDDKGVWTEPLALWSVAVEGTLLLLALMTLVLSTRAPRRSMI